MRKVKEYVIVIFAGILVGILTLFGQKYLPINLNFLANSGAMWLIPAFLFSYFFKENRLNSISLTIICLLGCVYGYYITEAVHNHHAFSLGTGALVWSVMSLLAGVVFGMGAYFANQERSRLKLCGMNLLPAVFAAEGIDNLLHFSDFAHMIPAVILKVVIGIVLYFVINGKASLKAKNIVSFGAITIIGVIAYTLLSFCV